MSTEPQNVRGAKGLRDYFPNNSLIRQAWKLKPKETE